MQPQSCPDSLPAQWLRQVGVTRALWVVLRQGEEIMGGFSLGYRIQRPLCVLGQQAIQHISKTVDLVIDNVGELH